MAAVSGVEAATKDHTMEVSIVGQKRTYVDATMVDKEESKEGERQPDAQIRGLQDIIKGLESQKRRRLV